MGLARLVAVAVLLIVGLVWIGQGIGLIGGSFMTGSTFWAAMGVVLVIVAVGLVVTARPRGAPHA